MKTLMKNVQALFVICALFMNFSVSAEDHAEAPAAPSLFDRIGGEAMAHKIVGDIWINHTQNPIVKDRFANSDPMYVKTKVYEIFAAATGGPVEYTGKDMKTTHAGMNISEMEFNAVVDDVLAALTTHGVAQQEQNEVLAILWSVRGDIVNSNITTKTLTAE
ncbi:MAG: group 1 truncated hemoglobin [Gammaproteobacteria bacterium]